MSEALTPFDYLLNAFESASQEDHPADHNYAGKRKALIAYVRGLEILAPIQAADAPSDATLSDDAICELWDSVDNTIYVHETAIKFAREIERALMAWGK